MPTAKVSKERERDPVTKKFLASTIPSKKAPANAPQAPLELELVDDEDEAEPFPGRDPGNMPGLSDDDAGADHSPAPAPTVSQEAQVRQLLSQALSMGRQLGLVTGGDGSFQVLDQATRQARTSSDCTCELCVPWNQQHWFCIVCDSGPHAWDVDKPRHERLVLEVGGIRGSRHACCTDQCAKDYVSRLQRTQQPRPVNRQAADPMLALP